MSESITMTRQRSAHGRSSFRREAGSPSPSNHVFADRPVSMQPERIQASSSETVILFGAFRLLPAQRLLLHGDKAVPLGSRALDILIALVERSGELMGKDELMARVWPNTF